MRKSIVVFLLTAIAALSALPTLAGSIPVPSGLHPCEQHDRLAFVTTDVNFVPQLATLATTWEAIGCTDAIDVTNNTGTNPTISLVTPIYLLDGTPLAVTSIDLRDGPLVPPLDITGAVARIFPRVDRHSYKRVSIPIICASLSIGPSKPIDR